MFKDLEKTHAAYQNYELPPFDPSQIYIHVRYARQLRAQAINEGMTLFIVNPVKAIVRRTLDAMKSHGGAAAHS
ncbi:hypothetical protein [Oceanibaculum nanhaiense]|jgi:uncharacterized lipoprotein YbaY|uniref:hypothetical protein n=1 Tax=Oceanibaculum nanhaiense TaxID=1909734 RepID=UPI000A393A02|nr:hypothetical protein [Oceanibaculum nanhaiense]MBC7134458.1 hypothetical protein [Oceanibaculum nanhaiense]MDM7946301.1 hypothetical protein [Oceanibaculum nanhaiense]|tara:strand:+ start:345 stop:566 length:222 start_codon:yes stop_codon:yes gene_type:complete